MSRTASFCLILLSSGVVQAWPPRLDSLGDPLPAGVTARLGTPRWRHPAALQYLQHSPDGRTLYAISQDGSVRLWDTATGRERSRITGEAHFWGGRFSADGTVLASLDRESILVHNLVVGKTSRLKPGGMRFASLSFSPDGRKLILGHALALATGKCAIEIWETTTDKHLYTLAIHTGPVHHLAVTPDGQTLISGGGDARIHLTDLASGKELPALGAGVQHQGGITGLALSRDGKTLVSTAEDMAIWDMVTRKIIKRLTLPVGAGGGSLAVSGDGRRVLTIGVDRLVRMWDSVKGKELWQTPILTYIGGACPSFAPDDETVAVPDGSQTIRLCEVETGRRLNDTEGHQAPLIALSFSPDGRTLATSAYENTVLLWEVATGKLQHRLELRGHSRAMAFSPDGKWLATGASEALGGTVRIWDLRTGKEKQKLLVGGTPSLGWEVYSLVFSADGKELRGHTSTGHQGWQLDTGKALRIPPRDPLKGTAVSLSPDGRFLIGMKSSGAEQLFLLQSTSMGVRPGSRFPITQTVTLSNAGSGVALASYSTVGQYTQPGWGHMNGGMAFDLPRGEPLMPVSPRLSLFGAGGSVAQFSPDMRLMLSLHMDRVMLREVASGKALWSKPLPGVETVQLAGDGRLILAFAARSVVSVWDAVTGEKRGEWRSSEPQKLQAVSRDGRWLATGHPDGTVLLWDVRAMATSREGAKPTCEAELEKLWADLLVEDPAKAFAAMERLAVTPEAATFIEKQLQSGAADQNEDVPGLLKSLDSRRFAEREAASRKLVQLGPLVRPALSLALRGNPTLEVRRRVEQLLTDISVPDRLVPAGEPLRRWRVVQVLEWAGERAALARLAGRPTPTLTATQAKAALQRLRGADLQSAR